jgi:hypothetical protein
LYSKKGQFYDGCSGKLNSGEKAVMQQAAQYAPAERTILAALLIGYWYLLVDSVMKTRFVTEFHVLAYNAMQMAFIGDVQARPSGQQVIRALFARHAPSSCCPDFRSRGGAPGRLPPTPRLAAAKAAARADSAFS